MPADPDRLAAIAAVRSGVFTINEALSAGLTRRQVARRAEQGGWRRLRRGIYCETTVYDSCDAGARMHLQLVAALLAAPHAVASHFSAGRYYEWPFIGSWDARPWLTADRGDSRRTPVKTRTWVIESARLPREHVVSVDALRLTGKPRTAVDLARHLPVIEGLVVVDGALARGDVDPDRLAGVLASCERWPGVRRARTVIDLADARSESPYESVARLQCHRAGIEVEPQAWLYDERGCIGRTDLRIAGHNAVLEIDGAVKYSDGELAGLWREKQRHERIEQAGIAVGRLSPAETTDHHVVADRIRSTCARAAVMAAAGTVRGWFGPPPDWYLRRRAG